MAQELSSKLTGGCIAEPGGSIAAPISTVLPSGLKVTVYTWP